MSALISIVTLLVAPIENIIFIYVLLKLFDCKANIKHHKSITLCLLLLLVSVAHLIPIIPNGYAFIPVVLITIMLIYCRVFLIGSALLHIVTCFAIYTLQMMFAYLSYYIIAYFYELNVFELMYADRIEKVWSLLLSKILFIFAAKLFIYKFKSIKFVLGKYERLIINIILTVTVIVTFTIGSLIKHLSGTRSNILLITILICLVILDIFTYHIIIKLSFKNQQLKESKMNEIKYIQTKRRLELEKEETANMYRLNHDNKNHWSCALGLIREGKTADAERYMLKAYDECFEQCRVINLCSNPEINQIINIKRKKCLRLGIKFEHKIIGDFELFDGFRCDVILFNLLDNAIEACLKTDDKWVLLTMYEDSKAFHIIVKNTILESVLKNNPDLKTTKINSKNHGFGHENIKEAALTYNGEVERYEEDNMFVAHVTIKPPAQYSNCSKIDIS